MTLSIEQALQQGVAAHQQDRLQAVEWLNLSILQSHPLQPDANHNLKYEQYQSIKSKQRCRYLK